MRRKTKGRKIGKAQSKLVAAAAVAELDKRQLNVRITNHAYNTLTEAAMKKGWSVAALLEFVARHDAFKIMLDYTAEQSQ